MRLFGSAFAGIGLRSTTLAGYSASCITRRADNLSLREAAVVALAFNVAMVVVAIVSIVRTVPAWRKESA